MEEIQEQINDSFDGLRKTDGTKYRGDKTKAINGALYSTGIFRAREREVGDQAAGVRAVRAAHASEAGDARQAEEGGGGGERRHGRGGVREAGSTRGGRSSGA